MQVPLSDRLEPEIQALGTRFLNELARTNRPWHRSWWDARLMDQVLGEAEVKVQLFRFIDALPALRSPGEIVRHLHEYLAEAGGRVPWFMSAGLKMFPPGATGEALLARLAKQSARLTAGRFIAGSNPAEALIAVKRMRRQRLAFTADLLGEAVTSDPEADAYRDTCLGLLNGLHKTLAEAPEVPLIDHDEKGPIPRVNLSVKLSSLTAHFDPLPHDQTADRVLERLRPIASRARQLGAFLNVDMEQYAVRDLTHAIFDRLLGEPAFADWDQAGIVVQAYLRDAMGDLERLRDWARRRGVPVTVRLVKGAYWDYEVIHAQQHGWPIPVLTRKWESDLNYEQCARFLVDHARVLRPAFASHNIRSLSAGLAMAKSAGLPRGAVEVQVLYGMGAPIARAVEREGYRARVYMPYGALLPGMAYLVRRLLENTSNDSFLKASSTGQARYAELLRNPEETGRMTQTVPSAIVPSGNGEKRDAAVKTTFQNEPFMDFARAEARSSFRAALDAVAQRLPLDCPVQIGGANRATAEFLESRDPGQWDRVVGRSGKATAEEALASIAAAQKAFPEWSSVPVVERVAVLRRAAEIMRRDRAELAAWEVFECAKPWREADADVCEAIDFCEYYAREMLRLSEAPGCDVPGETNARAYLPRGVVSVIAPWNFPLAIPMGMTAAALVAGNTVVFKPAEQSPVMGHHLARILGEAGLPPAALSYLPGVGEEVGPVLVEDPRVAMIAFTGSRNVGLAINAKAAVTGPTQSHVKRVIAEMGGKNALIIDDDADLDEAVIGALYSAFGYAGQKCSACSRLILLDSIHDAFLARLVEAAKTLSVGPAQSPDTDIPPVIDQEARDRVLAYRELARQEGRIVLEGDVSHLAARGCYVGPVIAADVPPQARLAQEEIFGPVLAVLRARDLDHAIAIALDVPYALTGGIYSRSPAHIERIKREFLVGNLYINRPITGALVQRQPFGGFKLSGIGTKAGGPDYLREFLLPRTITENTMRRGFAPELEQVGAHAIESGNV